MRVRNEEEFKETWKLAQAVAARHTPHKQYLKEHRHIVYTTMLIEGTLNLYLADINQQAEQMFHRLIEEMAQKQGVTEQLKAEQPMEWIGLMNNIQACAREVVNHDIIYN